MNDINNFENALWVLKVIQAGYITAILNSLNKEKTNDY